MEPALFGKSTLALSLTFAVLACATTEKTIPDSRESVESIADGSGWQPFPGASKDAAFLERTPAEFLPFVKACNPWDEWDKPAEPFRIHGTTFYVGTCGIAAIFIADPRGHVLIDSGTEAGAKIVLGNIRKLGFEPKDIVFLLHSHEHFDHVGGHALIVEDTGAGVVASVKSSAVLASGLSHPQDPQYGMHDPLQPVLVAKILSAGETIRVGETKLTPIETPGHTPGALSWQWESCEDDVCRSIVYADSLSPVSRDDYRFTDHPAYLEAYFDGLERLGRLDCDILLTPHPSHSRMIKRMRTNTMIEPASCAYYAIGKARDIEERIRKEGGAE